MKWTLQVNQKQCLDLGIKNINQAHIFDLLTGVATWAEALTIDGEVFYWVSRQEISRELVLLNLKEDTVYRHLKSLADLGLINYKKLGKKDCINITQKGKIYYVGNESEFDDIPYVGNKSEKDQNSDLNPTKLGNRSENNSDLNPTYPNTRSNPNTKTPRSSIWKPEDFVFGLPESLVKKIFTSLVGKHDSRFLSKLKNEHVAKVIFDEWEKQLNGITENQADFALSTWRDKWPPSSDEFRKLCIQVAPPKPISLPKAKSQEEKAKSRDAAFQASQNLPEHLRLGGAGHG